MKSVLEVDNFSGERIRGETARSLIELCTSSVEHCPTGANIAYLLCGFDVADLSKVVIERPGEGLYLIAQLER